MTQLAPGRRAGGDSMTPYYADEMVTLYLGDMRQVLPALRVTADAIVTDPPYGETGLPWDRWPAGWVTVAAGAARSMWCFGSLRMLLAHHSEFTASGWKLSQDVIWEKPTGTGMATDRFRRVHEIAAHWYQGQWREISHDTPRTPGSSPDRHTRARAGGGQHLGTTRSTTYHDDGTRLARSVQFAPSVRGGLHPTEKPAALLGLLISYACPPGGVIIDPFAGSGAALDAARMSGRRAIGIEAHQPYAEAAARRLSQAVLT
jgi:site-specific DNA-methyltransferase (adenine-specific)